MLGMLLHRPAGDEHVVHIDERKVEIGQNLIHHTLERLPGVLQPERHSQKLKRPKRRHDGCLRDILCGHRESGGIP